MNSRATKAMNRHSRIIKQQQNQQKELIQGMDNKQSSVGPSSSSSFFVLSSSCHPFYRRRLGHRRRPFLSTSYLVFLLIVFITKRTYHLNDSYSQSCVFPFFVGAAEATNKPATTTEENSSNNKNNNEEVVNGTMGEFQVEEKLQQQLTSNNNDKMLSLEDDDWMYFISSPSNMNDNDPSATNSGAQAKKSFQESMMFYRKLFQDPALEEIRQAYWKETLNDIRNLTIASFGINRINNYNNNSTAGLFNQWKLALSEVTSAFASSSINTLSSTSSNSSGSIVTTNDGKVDDGTAIVQFWKRRNQQRFEGFPSWERLLQDWSDEIQEYLDQVESQESLGYSMSNYGRPPSSTTTTNATTTTAATIDSKNITTLSNDDDDSRYYMEPASWNELDVTNDAVVGRGDNNVTSIRVSRKRLALPIPQPAKPGQDVLTHTDISDKSKRILIVTTAAMPWRTGTAVNPLLRAAYLTLGRKEYGGSVTLMVPWLERKEDQERVYGTNQVFQTPEDQTEYIRSWLRDSANMPSAADDLKIQWYTAWQNKIENSIYSMGDITSLISSDDIDVCILEEPEHLNWYRAPGESWTKKFPHVVGILHTNYFSYALDQPAALIRAPAMRLLCSWMCRAHCHRIIKLSGTLDQMAPEKELVENVHGVRGTFLDVGKVVQKRIVDTSVPSSTSNNNSTDPTFGAEVEPKIYFIGKLLWSKGLGSLMELLKYAEESAGLKDIRVDMYGGGPDMDAANARAVKLGLDMPFHGPLDHAELAYTHKIFVNPSASEVLCTTSAEALAMGKFVILPSHPSNDFFVQFPNCLSYATKEEFVGNLYYAMTHSPEPLTDVYLHALSWEAATERLIMASCIPRDEDEQLKQVVAANEAAIEISLPPILDGETRKARESLVTVLQFTRLRYRQFRTRLSSEIKATRVLPKPIGDLLISELDKRLDLDMDEILESPKLRIKLSPAELDKQLLELYDSISESAGGDVLRILGGGGQIALQNLYMKRHAERERWRKLKNKDRPLIVSLLPSFGVQDVTTEDFQRTASQWVRWSLRKNQQKLAKSLNLRTDKSKSPRRTTTNSDEVQDPASTTALLTKRTSDDDTDTKNTPTMSYKSFARISPSTTRRNMSGLCTWNGLCRKAPPQRKSKFAILI